MEDIRYDGTLDFKIYDVGYVSVLRNANFTFEYTLGKDRFSFIYVKSGEMLYALTAERKKIRIEKGDFLFIPKNMPYKSFYLADNTVIKMIVFDIAAESLPDYLNVPFSKRSVYIKNLFDSITVENMNSAFYLTAKIYEIFFYMQRQNFHAPKKYQKILPAVTEINQRYMQNNKLSYYAELCNMSESNFRRLFKDYTGKSLIDYRNSLRLLAAQKMIDSGELSISEAAYLAGFNNMSFFYKLYHRATKK